MTVAPKLLNPIGGSANDKTRMIYCTGAKAAQNDQIIISGITAVLTAQVMVTDATTRSVDTFTITDATPTVIKCTGATTGTVHILAVVR